MKLNYTPINNKPFDWYIGYYCGEIAGFIYELFWKIPDWFDYVTCCDGFSDGLEDELGH